jgi:cell division protein FtsW (lipid II flippase)
MPVDVDWRLDPAAIAKYHRGFAEFTRFDLAQGLAKKVEKSPLRFYGRLMDPGFSTLEEATATNWIRGWFFTVLVAWPIEVAVPLVIAAVLWLFGRRADESSRRARTVIAGAAAITLVLWFVTVPDGRYIWFATWAVAGAAAIPAFVANVMKRRTIVAGIATACVAVVVFRVGLQLVYRDGPIADVFVVRPGPEHGFHPAPIAIALTPWTSRHGLTLHYPGNGSGTVWYSPQPATTVKYLDPDLRFRGTDFQSGVRIDRGAISPSPP